MFKEKYPSAWIFHKNTCRSELNTIQPQNVQSNQDSYKEYLNVPSVVLPDVKKLPNTFSDLLSLRYSCRRFKNSPLLLQDIANILYAGYGLRDVILLENDEFSQRTVPSGGGLYPLELYLLVNNVVGINPGVYHYVMTPALLEQVKEIELPKSLLQNLFMQQPYVASAPAIIIATSVIERTMKKYFDRGYRYILFEAGHAFQNMNLMSTACQLGSLNIGGFFDNDICKILGIDSEEEIPLYAMAIGVPDGNYISARLPT